MLNNSRPLLESPPNKHFWCDFWLLTVDWPFPSQSFATISDTIMSCGGIIFADFLNTPAGCKFKSSCSSFLFQSIKKNHEICLHLILACTWFHTNNQHETKNDFKWESCEAQMKRAISKVMLVGLSKQKHHVLVMFWKLEVKLGIVHIITQVCKVRLSMICQKKQKWGSIFNAFQRTSLVCRPNIMQRGTSNRQKS